MRKSVIIGGIWGLVTGILFLYIWGVFAGGFTGDSDMGMLFKHVSIIWKAIFLPAYLTDLFFGLLGVLSPVASALGLPFFVAWCIGMPIFFGAILGMGIEYLISRFRKNNTVK